jgi:hypothetical protein
MQFSSRFLVAAAATIALAGCTNGATTQPASRSARTTPSYIEPKTPASPTVASQPGFENELPRPDPGITGEGTAYESDIGEPRWRNNPGGYDDGTRPKKVEGTSHQHAIEGNRSLPPTTTGTEQ